MTDMDAQTAVDDVEKFLAAWNASCMQHLGVIISQAGFDHDAPVLTTGHLHALLNALHTQRGELERVRGEDARTEKPSPHSDDWIINDLLFRARRCDANATAWDYPGVGAEADRRRHEAKRYRQLVAVARDVWATADAAETTATRPADGLTGTGEGPTLPTRAQGAQRGAEGDGADGGRCICGCPLGQRCHCDDSADHGDPNAVDPSLGGDRA